MNIIEAKDEDQFATEAAAFFEAFVVANDNPLVTLPTGNTPLPFYKKLFAAYQRNPQINNFTYLSLDEYYGLAPDDHRLFANWLDREILEPLELPEERRVTINSACDDVESYCKSFEASIQDKGGIDLAVIGLGGNGHIGFNEPGSALDSRTRRIALAQQTIEANASYWGSEADVPKAAITLGIGTLKEARHTLLLVRGEGKADILRDTFTAPVSSAIPATYLQRQDNVTVIADSASLSLMRD